MPRGLWLVQRLHNPNNVGCLTPTGVAVLSNPAGPLGAAGAVAAMVGGLQRLDTVRNVGDDTANFDQTSSNFAFFTHNIFHVTSNVDLTVGLRYTNETKKLNANFNNTNTICPVQQANLLPFMGVPALAPLAGGIITLTCQGGSSSALNGLTLNDQRKEELSSPASLSFVEAGRQHPALCELFARLQGRRLQPRSARLSRTRTSAQPLPIFPISLANAGYYADVLQIRGGDGHRL